MGVPSDKQKSDSEWIIEHYKFLSAAAEASEVLKVETQHYFQEHRTPQAIKAAAELLDLFKERRLLCHARHQGRQLSWLAERYMYGDRSGQEWPVKKAMLVMSWSDHFIALTRQGEWLYVRHRRGNEDLAVPVIEFPASAEYLIKALVFDLRDPSELQDGSLISSDPRHVLWTILSHFESSHGHFVNEQKERLKELEETFEFARIFTTLTNIPFWEGREKK